MGTDAKTLWPVGNNIQQYLHLQVYVWTNLVERVCQRGNQRLSLTKWCFMMWMAPRLVREVFKISPPKINGWVGSEESIRLKEVIFSIKFFQFLCFPLLKFCQFCQFLGRWVGSKSNGKIHWFTEEIFLKPSLSQKTFLKQLTFNQLYISFKTF